MTTGPLYTRVLGAESLQADCCADVLKVVVEVAGGAAVAIEISGMCFCSYSSMSSAQLVVAVFIKSSFRKSKSLLPEAATAYNTCLPWISYTLWEGSTLTPTLTGVCATSFRLSLKCALGALNPACSIRSSVTTSAEASAGTISVVAFFFSLDFLPADLVSL